MYSPTSPINIDARRHSAYPEYDYGLTVEPAPPFGESTDMMFDMDGSYDYSNNTWQPNLATGSVAAELASPLAPVAPASGYALMNNKDTFLEPSAYLGHDLAGAMDDDYNWAGFAPSSAPIAIPEAKHQASQQQQQQFMSYVDYHSPLFQDLNSFSPAFSPSSFSPESDFAALHSPTSPAAYGFQHDLPAQQPHYGTPTEALSALTISPQDTNVSYNPAHAPGAWTNMWAPQPQLAQHQPSSPMTPTDDTFQPRSYVQEAMHRRARAPSQSLLFHPSTSAPSVISPIRAPPMARGYSHQSEPAVATPERGGRRRSRGQSESASEPDAEDVASAGRAVSPASEKAENAPQKSQLRPPKLAPSAWQLYFTDWIAKHQQSSTKKLNVAQAAKEAGVEYAALSTEEKEPYRRKSQQAKEAREREHNAYMRTLTPEDIKKENVFRTAQRKAGKSRRGNLKDPNAPKKPLSAYFMFLQRIRSDPELVLEVFGEETETTKQSVLAASKWRSMTDDERKPFLAQAEQEKLDYEEKRKVYEQGHTGYTGSFNFSILSSSPIDSAPIPRKKVVKREPEDGALSS